MRATPRCDRWGTSARRGLGAVAYRARDSRSAFAIISVEDLIADRMGQYASGTARDRIDQARLLLRLHPEADPEYLDRRIREESSGDHGIDDIKD